MSRVVDQVGPACHGGQQSAAAADGSKMGRVVACCGEFFFNQRGAIAGSGQHGAAAKLVDFLIPMVHRTRPFCAFSVENTELGGG